MVSLMESVSVSVVILAGGGHATNGASPSSFKTSIFFNEYMAEVDITEEE